MRLLSQNRRVEFYLRNATSHCLATCFSKWFLELPRSLCQWNQQRKCKVKRQQEAHLISYQSKEIVRQHTVSCSPSTNLTKTLLWRGSVLKLASHNVFPVANYVCQFLWSFDKRMRAYQWRLQLWLTPWQSSIACSRSETDRRSSSPLTALTHSLSRHISFNERELTNWDQ